MQVSNAQSETQRRTWVRKVPRWIVALGILALMPELMGLGGCPCGDDADCPDGDFCDEGACVDCRDDADCSPELPVCVDTFCEECGVAADCDDADACTTDTCDENNECMSADVECPEGETCVDGDCEVTCTADSDCEDADVCTMDACVDGICINVEVNCDDGDLCTLDSCDSAVGCANDPLCDAGFECDPDTGECFAPCTSDVECDDDDLCTTDTCTDGICSNAEVDCEDDDACTIASCDPDTGDCVTDPLCDDGDLCTTGNCTDGVCDFVATVCSPGLSCNPASGDCDDATSMQVDVLQLGGFSYPTGLFRCGAPEDPQDPSESCPEGSGCDEYHWHSDTVAAIASVTGGANVSGNTIDDPDLCMCGHGKVSEVTRTMISLDGFELANYLSLTNLDELPAAGACPP